MAVSPTVKVTITLPADVIKDLEEKSKEAGKTVSDLINEAVPEVLVR